MIQHIQMDSDVGIGRLQKGAPLVAMKSLGFFTCLASGICKLNLHLPRLHPGKGDATAEVPKNLTLPGVYGRFLRDPFSSKTPKVKTKPSLGIFQHELRATGKRLG